MKLKKGSNQLLPAMISVRTKESEGDADTRSPIDFVCVIDHSGSMGGSKIELVRSTLKQLLEILNEKDRLCLVQFDSSSERLTPLICVSEGNRHTF